MRARQLVLERVDARARGVALRAAHRWLLLVLKPHRRLLVLRQRAARRVAKLEARRVQQPLVHRRAPRCPPPRNRSSRPSTKSGIRRFGLCLEADPDLWAIVVALAQVDGREMAPPAETTNPALAAAIRAGHVNISGDSASSQTMELSETSRDAQDRHALLLQRVEAERRARAIVVPTQVKDVREKLRDLGHAVRLFGENDADVRERLRLLLARIETSGEAAAHADAPSAMTHLFHPMLVPTPTQPQRQGDMPADANGAPSAAADEASAAAAAQEALKSDVYTRASAELVAARGAIASLSFARSTERLATLRRRYSDVEQLNRETHRQYCAIMVRATRRPHCPRPPDLVILPTPPLPPFPPNHAPSPFSLSLSLFAPTFTRISETWSRALAVRRRAADRCCSLGSRGRRRRARERWVVGGCQNLARSRHLAA